MQQLLFAFDAPAAMAVLVDDGLTCAFGEPWMGDHPKCRAFTEESVQRFHEMVVAGIYDADGYTPAERKMKMRRELIK